MAVVIRLTRITGCLAVVVFIWLTYSLVMLDRLHTGKGSAGGRPVDDRMPCPECRCNLTGQYEDGRYLGPIVDPSMVKQPGDTGAKPDPQPAPTCEAPKKEDRVVAPDSGDWPQSYFDPNDEVHPIIKAFRRAKVDWHDLLALPQDSPVDKLIKAERKMAEYLLNLPVEEKTRWGINHGPLGALGKCEDVHDKCVVHTSKNECFEDSFCGWCPSLGACVDAANAQGLYATRLCPTDLEFEQRKGECRVKLPPGINDQSQCKRFIRERTFIETIPDNAGAMYWHWLRDYFMSFTDGLRSRGFAEDRLNHIILARNEDIKHEFVQFFGLISKFCVRREEDLPRDVCFCEDPIPGGSPTSGGFSDFVVDQLGLRNEPEAPVPRVGILSRQVKRFIVNERELCAEAQLMGMQCILLPMEKMTLFEQIREMRRLTILVGIHGSGMSNIFYMKTGTRIWQLFPYNAADTVSMMQGITPAGVTYKEWRNDNIKNAVFHWHFVAISDRNYEMFNNVADYSQGSLFYTFWLNQDTYIPRKKFRQLLLEDYTPPKELPPSPIDPWDEVKNFEFVIPGIPKKG